jgi:hypothetical protein
MRPSVSPRMGAGGRRRGRQPLSRSKTDFMADLMPTPPGNARGCASGGGFVSRGPGLTPLATAARPSGTSGKDPNPFNTRPH